MKNIIKNFVKTQEQKSKLDLISELLVSGSVQENIDLFNKVKANFHLAMDLERQRKEKEINLINRIRPIKQYNTDFDKPAPKDCDVIFELVEPIKN